MTASPFLTRLEVYRAPKTLWPLAAGLSVLAHAVLLLSLHPWAKVAPSQDSNRPQAIPIQILALPSPSATPLDTPSVSPAPEAIQADATPASEEPPLALESPPSTPPNRPPPVLQSPQASQSPSADPPTTPPLGPTSIPNLVPIPPTVTPSPSVTPTATIAPPPTVTPSPTVTPAPTVTPPPSPSPTGGQLWPLGVSPTAYGSDWPDTPPQLLNTAAIAVAPWLDPCGVADVGAIASPGTTVQIPLRVRVEADGHISTAYVDASSGNPALDNLVICIGQRQLRLTPASVNGQPQVTDAYQVEMQVQF